MNTKPYSTILANLPDLPQVRYIRHAAEALGPRQDVQAFWLGGSFARGNPDLFSDVDMRIAVAREDLGAWHEPDLAGLLGDAVVGHQILQFDDTSFLHHLVLSEGTIVDFYVQSVEHPISRDAHLILKCEDMMLHDRIREATRSEHKDLPAVNPQELKAALEEFWIVSHKHAKVLFRDDPEFGLFYAVSPAHQRRGYAVEATRAIVKYAFEDLYLRRIVATTTYRNTASIRVMEKVGMQIERNPYRDPPWFQVVGILENHAA